MSFETIIAAVAKFGGADLRGADLRGADLRDALLEGADLTGADLRGAFAARAVLESADLTGADIRGADLRAVAITGAVLTDADIRGAEMPLHWGGPFRGLAPLTRGTTAKFDMAVLDATVVRAEAMGCTHLAGDLRTIKRSVTVTTA